MGEHADDMIEGRACQLCGQIFEKNGNTYEHGTPVVCWDCWEELTNKEKKMYDKAKVNTFLK